MKNKDLIQRFLFENISIRGEIVHLNESFQTIVNQHAYPLSLQKLMGEFLVSVTLLVAILKIKGRLTIQFQGKNKLKLVIAQSTNEFFIRGLSQWQENIEADDIKEIFEAGILTITIDPETGGKRYQGIVNWKGNSVASSIEGYFKDSEQLPTKIWIAVDRDCASGLLLQIIPKEISEKQLSTAMDDWEHISTLTNTITPNELLNLETETLLHRLYSQEAVRVFQPNEISFQCTCSVARSENALLLLGLEEVEEELKNKQNIVVTCEFCNKEFSFDRVDIARIFKLKRF